MFGVLNFDWSLVFLQGMQCIGNRPKNWNVMYIYGNCKEWTKRSSKVFSVFLFYVVSEGLLLLSIKNSKCIFYPKSCFGIFFFFLKCLLGISCFFACQFWLRLSMLLSYKNSTRHPNYEVWYFIEVWKCVAYAFSSWFRHHAKAYVCLLKYVCNLLLLVVFFFNFWWQFFC